MASRFGLSNRRTMQLVAVIILAFIFIVAIVLFAALRRGSDDLNVNVRLTTTPASPVAAVATTPPTPTVAPTSTLAPTAVLTPTAAPAPTTPPPPTPTAAPQPPPPAVGATVPPTAAPPGKAGPAPTPPAPPPAAPPPAGGAPGIVATVPPLPTQQTQPAPPKPPAGAPPPPAAAPTPTPANPPASKVGSGPGTQMQVAQGQEATLRCLGDRVTITVRPGTMPRPVTLSCRMGAAGQAPNPPGPRLDEVLFTIEAEGLGELPAEVNLGVGYDDDDLEGLEEGRLTIGHLQNGQWQPAPKQAPDAPNNYVSATITRLGTYTVYQRP